MSDDAAKKQCEILDEAQRRFGHQVSQWREAGQSVLNEAFPRAVPPAMQRALGEGEYNTIGDELRKLNERVETIFQAALESYTHADTERIVKERGESLGRIEAAEQLIMQKLESLRAEVACKCVVIAKFRGGYAQDPSKCPVHGYPAPEIARKRQPKPVRRKKGRK